MLCFRWVVSIQPNEWKLSGLLIGFDYVWLFKEKLLKKIESNADSEQCHGISGNLFLFFGMFVREKPTLVFQRGLLWVLPSYAMVHEDRMTSYMLYISTNNEPWIQWIETLLQRQVNADFLYEYVNRFSTIFSVQFENTLHSLSLQCTTCPLVQQMCNHGKNMSRFGMFFTRCSFLQESENLRKGYEIVS